MTAREVLLNSKIQVANSNFRGCQHNEKRWKKMIFHFRRMYKIQLMEYMNWHGQYVRCEEELRKIKSEINDTRVEGVNDAKKILLL